MARRAQVGAGVTQALVEIVKTQGLGCRVDWLQVAYGITLSPACEEALRAAQALADVAGRAEFREAGFAFELRRNSNPGRFVFSNADVGGMIDLAAPGGWPLVLSIRALFLATHRIDEAVTLCRRIARGFGRLRKERLRRFDLAGDYAGFPLEPSDIDRLHTRARKRTTFLSEPKDADGVSSPEVRMYTNAARNVTGITVAPGQELMCRIYDKSAELALAGREEKRQVEEPRWRLRDWSEGSVTRVEMQHRGEHLADLGLRNSEDEAKLRVLDLLLDRLDAIWQRDVREWLRIIEPESSTRRDRCRVDPRWLAVQETVFHHESSPIALRRMRGGPSDAHAVGVVLSYAAANGHLEPIPVPPSAPKEQASDGLVEAFADLDAAEQVLSLLGERVTSGVQAATDDYVRCLIAKHGPRRAREIVCAKVNGVRARFSSADDASGILAKGRG